MRPTDEQLRGGLLHPQRILRNAALEYFANSYSPDPANLPAVAAALERYGRAAFSYPHLFQRLAVSDEMAEWAVYQLTIPRKEEEDARQFARMRSGLADLLYEAHPRWLAARGHDVCASGVVDFEGREQNLRHCVTSAALDGQGLWRELESLAERHCCLEEWHDDCFDQGLRIVSLLAHQGQPHAPAMMALLERFCDDFTGDPFAWMELFVVELAGRLRYEPAVPLLIRRLLADPEYEDERLGGRCEIALARIGGDVVARAIWERWPENERFLQFSLASLLGTIHTDLSSDALRDLSRREVDLELRASLADAALGHFVREDAELWRDAVEVDTFGNAFKEPLVAACLLHGIDEPKLEQWSRDVEQVQQKLTEAVYDWLAQEASRNAIDQPEWEYEADDEWRAADDFVPSPEPLRAQKTAGRNDPCPCGSGKKFKKCCLRNSSIVD